MRGPGADPSQARHVHDRPPAPTPHGLHHVLDHAGVPDRAHEEAPFPVPSSRVQGFRREGEGVVHEVVDRAAVHGGHRRGHVVHRADDDAVRIRQFLPYLVQHFHAAHVGHHEIQEHQAIAVQSQQAHDPAAVGHQRRFRKTGADQGGLDAEQQALIVVDYKNGSVFGRYFH